MLEMLMPVLGTLLRHGLTVVGGGILVKSGSDVETITGAILTLIGAGLSIYKSYTLKQK